MELTVPHKFEPRDYQLPFFQAMDAGLKRAVLVHHRRAGKDKACLNFMAKEMLNRVGSYFYILPTYTQAKKIIWEGIDKDGFKFLDHIPKELRKRTDNTEMVIELKNGSIFRLIGSDKIDSIVGTNPIGIVFSEYSLQDPLAWQMLRPILAENKGWAVFNFTPRGKNHAYGIFKIAQKSDNWFCNRLTIKDTNVLTIEDMDREREEGMSDELIQQEYFCSFEGSIEGSYYGKIMRKLEEETRIRNNLYEPTVPVSTYWDLGMNDSNSILFVQIIGNEIRFIDYYETSGEGLGYYAKYLKEKPYTYDRHYFPHDAEVRELGTGKSRKEIAESLGIKPIEVVKRPEAKEDGIEAVRSMLPRVYIDETKCERLIDCLNSYSKKWDEKNKVYKNTPNHDWSSHGADAVQTFALGYKELIKDYNTPEIKYDPNGIPIAIS